jgi:hypothetical protein
MRRRTGFRDPTSERGISAVDRAAAEALLLDALDALTEIERLVLAARFCGLPRAMLATRFGTTRDRIRHVESSAVSKIEGTNLLTAFIGEEPAGILADLVRRDWGLAALMDMYQSDGPPFCRQCAGPIGTAKQGDWSVADWLSLSRAGRPPRYCSARCRQRAYRARRAGSGLPRL